MPQQSGNGLVGQLLHGRQHATLRLLLDGMVGIHFFRDQSCKHGIFSRSYHTGPFVRPVQSIRMILNDLERV